MSILPADSETATSSSTTSSTSSTATTTGTFAGTTMTSNNPSPNSSKGTSRPTLGRVSITFDAGPDSSVSRDFPGRPYDNKDKKLLQEWSKEFRQGVPCHQNIDDKRTVPNKTNNHRRKPFIGSSNLTRHCAYHWFRQTQKRLVDKAIVKLTNATTITTPMSMSLPSSNTCSSKQENQGNQSRKGNIKGARQLSLEKQLCACPIHCLIPNVYDKGASSHSPFVEVEWRTNHTMEFQEQVRAQYRTHIGIQSTGTATMQLHPVYLLSNGNGGYFQATDLPVGTFTVNGVQFTVIDTSTGSSNNTKKAKKRSRKKQPPTAEVPATATTMQSQSTCIPTATTTAATMDRPRKKEKRGQHNHNTNDWPVAPSFSYSSSHASSFDSMLPVVPFLEPQLCRVKSFTPQVFILDEPTGEQYVTVEWAKPNNQIAPPRYTTIGATTVELFPVGNGQSVFRASNLQVGNYVVDGVSFSVIRTPFPHLIGGVRHV